MRTKAIRRARALGVAAVAMICLVAAGAVFAFRAQSLPERAAAEGALVIYSATDASEFGELLREFRRQNPRVAVSYKALPARTVYEQYRREAQQGVKRTDLLINSAMDLQIKLVNDRLAQEYKSPERQHLPDWAVWKNQAYAISTEPIVIGYNPKLLGGGDVPRSHDQLAQLLYNNPALFDGRVGLYNPKESPTGYLYITQDVRNDSDAWELLAAIGRARPELFVSTQAMLDAVSSGKLLVAYNVIGSYAFERAQHDPNFAVAVPQDYALMMSRVALIARDAPHPAAAKLFLDFLISKQGQQILSRHHMTPLRTDVASPAASFAETNVRAVRVGPALMAGLDQLTLATFDRRWAAVISQKKLEL